MYNDSGINSSRGWWPSLQGGDTPTHAIIYSKQEKKKAWQKEDTKCKTETVTIWSITWVIFVFPGNDVKMKADAVAFACSIGHRMQDVVLSLSCIFIIQLGMCAVWFSSAWHNIPKHSLPSDQKNNRCSAWLKLKLGTSQPPTPTPIQQRKRPHPKFGRRHQMVVVFVLLTLFLSLSFNVANACLALNIQVVLL